MSFAILGPSGGVGGRPFDDEPPRRDAAVREVRVWAGSLVDAIQLVLEVDGQTIEGSKHGGASGDLGVVHLAEKEFVTEIYGRYGSYVDSLNIRTNTGQTARFGGQGGANEYLYVAPQGYQIIGFWGRAGRLLDSIGIHLGPADLDRHF